MEYCPDLLSLNVGYNSCKWCEESDRCNRFILFFFKQKTAYEMCGRDWSSDVCSSDLMTMACFPAKSAANQLALNRKALFEIPTRWKMLTAEKVVGCELKIERNVCHPWLTSENTAGGAQPWCWFWSQWFIICYCSFLGNVCSCCRHGHNLGCFRTLDARLASSLVCDHRARDVTLCAHARVEWASTSEWHCVSSSMIAY